MLKTSRRYLFILAKRNVTLFVCPSVRLSRAALWWTTSCELKRIQRVFWGSCKTQAAAVRPPLTNVSPEALNFYFGNACSGYLPGYLTSPFLNGIIFSAGPSGAMHCGPWCCQAVHKLTRKPVASAFPRPFGAVMFTTPRPPVLTPLCVRAPPHQPPNQLVQPSITVHQIQVQKLFCAKGVFFFLVTKTGEMMGRKAGVILIELFSQIKGFDYLCN